MIGIALLGADFVKQHVNRQEYLGLPKPLGTTSSPILIVSKP